MRKRYTASATSGKGYLHSGYKVKKFGGLVTGIGQSNAPDNAAIGMLNLNRENGSLKVRNGYRNLIAPVTNVTTVKGFHRCQTYVGEVLKECVLAFLYDGSNLNVYELNYDASTDVWSYHVVTNAASAVNLDNTYWRVVCFQDTVYFFNTNDATTPIWSYTIGSYTSARPVAPPATPTVAPTVLYYLSSTPGYSYLKYWAAQASYATTDVARSGAVDTITAISGTYIKASVNTTGAFTVTPNLKHSGGNTDLTNNDVFSFTVTINDTTKIAFDENLTVTVNGSGSQELVTTIASRQYDTVGSLKTITYYCKFGGKTPSAWTTATTFTISGFITNHGSDDFLFIGPLTAGGIVDWGTQFTAVTELAYSAYNSTNTQESGLSPLLDLDLTRLNGQLLGGNAGFPMGSIPIVGITAGPADKFRLYGRVQIDNGGNGSAKRPNQYTAWRRIVEQDDSTATYNLRTLANDFQTLSEYAPANFDTTGIMNAYTSNNHVVWCYGGGPKNVRRSRDGVALAQASPDDAFKTSVAQDDVLRGNNHTLVGDFQDEPLGGIPMPGGDVLIGKNNVYVSYDLGDGLPAGFSHPEPVAGAPGCMGYHAFCRWHDSEGVPIVVYLDTKGFQLWAVRVPRGYTPGQPLAQAAWEFGSLVRGGFDVFLFGESQLRDAEATMVYVDSRDDSLHLRYNQRELILRRPDIVDGFRHWETVNYGTGQWASGWQKVISFSSSAVKHGTFGLRLNGAVDEFEEASMKDAVTGGRLIVPIDGRSATPTTCNASVATFTEPPGWSSGTPVVPSASGNSLTAGTTYYIGKITYLTYSLYDTQAHAQAAGVTGRVNLVSAPWAAGSLTPVGRDDGAAIDTSIYWQGIYPLGDRRRPRRVHVQKTTRTDSFTVTVYDEFGNSKSATVASGLMSAPFAVGLAGYELSYKVAFLEGNDPIDGLWAEEETIGQRRGIG